MKYISGITLIELMLAILISVFLLACCTSVFLAAESHFRQQSALNQMTENAEIAHKILAKNIGLAGFIGCARLSNDFPVTQSISYPLTTSNKLMGFKKGNSDAITVRHMGTELSSLMDKMQSVSILYVAESPEFSRDEILIIADCKSAEIFSVKNVLLMVNGRQKIISNNPLKKLYGVDACIGKLEVTTFFVADTKRYKKNNVPVYALYEKDIFGNKTELVEGVDKMVLQYSIKNNESMVDVDANVVADWASVIGVSIRLELSPSENNFERKVRNLYVAL